AAGRETSAPAGGASSGAGSCVGAAGTMSAAGVWPHAYRASANPRSVSVLSRDATVVAVCMFKIVIRLCYQASAIVTAVLIGRHAELVLRIMRICAISAVV